LEITEIPVCQESSWIFAALTFFFSTLLFRCKPSVFCYVRQVKASNRVKSTTNMVYWYGSWTNPQFSLLATNNLLSYEEGIKKGLGILPKAATKKLEKGEELTGKQLEQMHALDEMNDDLKKEPGKRFGYIPHFREVYEIAPEEKQQKKSKKKIDEVGGDMVEEDSGKVKPKVKSKGKTDEAGTGSTETSFEVSQPKKKQKTKTKITKTDETSSDGKKEGKAKKTKRPDLTADMDDEKEEVSGPGDKAVKESKIKVQSDGLTMEDIGDDDLPSDDDKNDEDVEPETESDEDDVDFDPLPKISSSKKSKANKPSVKKEPPVKKATSDKPKIKPQKELSLAKLKKKEQADFEECESKFRGLVKQWESAIKDPEVGKKKIEMILTELLKNVDKFSAPFIEVYNLSGLMKLTKKAHDGEKRKELWAKMKSVYNTKFAALPQGFKVTVSGPTSKKGTKTSPSVEAAVETANDDGKLDGEAIARSIKSEPGVGSDMVEPSPSQTNAPMILHNPIKRTCSVEQIASQVKIESSDPAPPPPLPDSALSPVKVERKRFSLGNLFNPSEKEAKSKVRHSMDRPPSSLSQVSRQPKFPTWISEPTLLEVSGDVNREFALEHLQQAAPTIPVGKHVNHNAVARSLEHAIYDWSRQKHNSVKDTSWEDKYWNKVHDIVAAICGNREPGTLAAMISEGRIQSPAVLLNLSDDDLMTSFEGRPLSL
jgi:hypothetical protein